MKSKMYKTVKTISMLAMLLPMGFVLAQTAADYKTNLTSETEEVAVKAIREAGAKKDAETLDTLIEILQTNPNPKIRMEAAHAIGKMEVKDKPVNALSNAAKTDKNNMVVYSALLSMTNLTKVEKNLEELPIVLETVAYCRENKSDDIYIKDLVTKYDQLIATKKKKK